MKRRSATNQNVNEEVVSKRGSKTRKKNYDAECVNSEELISTAENEKRSTSETRKKGQDRKSSPVGDTSVLIKTEPQNCAINKNAQLTFGLKKLRDPFYDVPCEHLAKSLLGKILVRRFDDGTIVKGRIVETECYPGGDDKASVSYNGKMTPRNKPVFMKPGTMFVYLTYGMYHCFNISSQGTGSAVLLRALEPLVGLEYMQQQRMTYRKGGKKESGSKSCTLKNHELCSGPAKLCMCFDINVKQCNTQDLCVWDEMWIESDDASEKIEHHHIVTSTRIGIDSVGKEWASKPLRFYLFGYKSVSRLDKRKENELQGVLKEAA